MAQANTASESLSNRESVESFGSSASSLRVASERQTILQEAQALVYGSRQGDYGHPREDYQRTVAIFRAITGHDLTAAEGVWFMIAVKLSRQSRQHKRDNLTDLCGYTECLARIIGEDD